MQHFKALQGKGEFLFQKFLLTQQPDWVNFQYSSYFLAILPGGGPPLPPPAITGGRIGIAETIVPIGAIGGPIGGPIGGRMPTRKRKKKEMRRVDESPSDNFNALKILFDPINRKC